jgi:hypothetical protein
MDEAELRHDSGRGPFAATVDVEAPQVVVRGIARSTREELTVSIDPVFTRGDCNGDGNVIGEVTDAVFLLSYNFTGGPEPPCLAACDANGDGSVVGEVSDAIYLLAYNFLGGPPPAAPFPERGPGTLPGDAVLGCKIPQAIKITP